MGCTVRIPHGAAALFVREIVLRFFRLFRFLFGNGIVTAAAKGIATEYAPDRKSEANEKTALFKRLDGILRASRGEPTGRGAFQGGKHPLVKANKKNTKVFHGTDSVLRIIPSFPKP